MQEKISFMEHIRASLEMLAGGVLWAAFGGVFGTALEAWAARVNGRRMGFWDYVIAYIIAVSAGMMIWLYVSGTSLEPRIQAVLTMGGCLVGREIGPLMKDIIADVFFRRHPPIDRQ